MAKESSTNQFNRNAALVKCPVTFTLEQIGGRWKPLIIYELRNGKMRYNELRKTLPLISEKMLIQQLKDLENDGLIVREARQVVPPFVEYSLSIKGEALRPVLQAMADWGIQHQSLSRANRVQELEF